MFDSQLPTKSHQATTPPLIMKFTFLRAAFLAPCIVTSLSTAQVSSELDVRYISPGDWKSELKASIDAGKIEDPAKQPLIEVAPLRGPSVSAATVSTSNVIFPFEDTGGVLVGQGAPGELFAIMAQAANEVVNTHGDDFDFIGYWMNFAPSFQLGSAFYLPIQNDVTGIGDPSGSGAPVFNQSGALGLASDKIQGFVMMHNINDGLWAPGNGPDAAFTRLVLAQEFGHRFGMFLPTLLDGRVLQGDDAGCGRSAHWNFRVDGQGSGMEIGEWVGSNPATLLSGGFGISFNKDSARSPFSFPDLYLMGYVSAFEMDTMMSEFRYMTEDSADCFPGATYDGVITNINSGNIISAAGLRVPDDISSQKEFRCAWVMLHQPGSPPTRADAKRAAGIANQQQQDWFDGTLGRGVLDNSLFDLPHAVPSSIQPSSLRSDLSQAAPGQSVALSLDAGIEQAGKAYRLIGSISGSQPGVTISAETRLPLNIDDYSRLTMTMPNADLFTNFVGNLDSAGRAQAALNLPSSLGPTYFGLKLQHAFATLDESGGITFASNAVTITLVQ